MASQVKVMMTCSKCDVSIQGYVPAGWGYRSGDMFIQDHVISCELVAELLSREHTLRGISLAHEYKEDDGA